jgi:23S rRNA (adenine-N6)-dimethyltransferase
MPAAPRAQASGGVHFLAVPRIAHQLIQSCPLSSTDLVLELGAGQGAITAPLADTGARILAVERDAQFVHRLRRRFAERDNVRIIHADARKVALPRKGFTVIASIPYALSTTLFRRLLSPQHTALRRAAFVVEWGFAKRLTAAVPRTLEQAWWAARFEMRLVSRVPAKYFSPPPRVDSAHLALKRVHLDAWSERALWTLLDAAYSATSRPARVAASAALAGRNPHNALRVAGIDPAETSSVVTPRQWAALAKHLSTDRTLRWPPLPRTLRS